MRENEKTEHEALIDSVFELFKGETYLSMKETLEDCLLILEVRAKVV